MILEPKDIPVEFLREIPEGIKLVTRHGHPFLVMEKVEDAAGHSLMDESVKIHGEPTIKLRVKVGRAEGLIYIDSFWGSHAKLYSFIPDFSEGNTVEAFSPADNTSLMVPWKCPVEGCDETSGIIMRLPGLKNTITVCGKLGCPGHHIDIFKVPEGVSEQISSINFFGTGMMDDDLFGF